MDLSQGAHLIYLNIGSHILSGVSPPLFAQISFANVIRLKQLLGGARRNHASGLKNNPLMRDLKRLKGVLFDQKDGFALAVDLLNNLKDALNDLGG